MKRFLECLVPDTTCNMKCEYCYIIQQNRKKSGGHMPYPTSHIVEALSQKRLGGVSFISITAEGETLVRREVIDIVHKLLKEGHYVNVTTNGTLSRRFKELLDIEREFLLHLNVSFSMHYQELIRLGKLQDFFENIQLVRASGSSFVLQINLCDSYAEHWADIKSLCFDKTGAYPQVALTRRETPNGYEIFTNRYTELEYVNKAREMDSPLFEVTYENFNKRQKNFCYAGAWSAKLNLFTGEMSACYGYGRKQNIYKDLKKPIVFTPIGYCPHRYCVNSSHFLSLGVQPDLIMPSYGQLRNRLEAGWYSKEMTGFLNSKLYDFNQNYNSFSEFMVYWFSAFCITTRKIIAKFFRVLRGKFYKYE